MTTDDKMTSMQSRTISLKKLLAITLGSLILSIVISCLDRLVLRDMELIPIDDYDAILIAAWQAQIILSALTVAFICIFTQTMKEVCYGHSVKELLSLSRYSIFQFNFYELIILVILLNIVSFPAVLANSLMMAASIALLASGCIIAIIYQSLNLSTGYDYIHLLAEHYVYDVLEKAKQLSASGSKNYPRAAESYLRVMEKVSQSLDAKIARGAVIQAWKDEDLRYLDKAIDSFPPEHELRTRTLAKLEDMIYEGAIDGNWKLTCCAYLHLSSKDALPSVSTTLYHLLQQHYTSPTAPRDLLDTIYYSLLRSKSEPNQLLLITLTQSLKYADLEMIWRVLSEIPRQRAGVDECYLIHSSYAYMYYLAFCESLYPESYGAARQQQLRGAPMHPSLSETTQRLLTEQLWTGVLQLLRERDEDFFSMGRITYGLEIQGQGFKLSRMQRDMMSYCIFFLYSALSHPYHALPQEQLAALPLRALLDMRKHMTDTGDMIAERQQDYSEFCDWLGLEKISQNDYLLTLLHELIKQKILEKAEAGRATLRAQREEVVEQCRQLERAYQHSELYRADLAEESSGRVMLRARHMVDIIESHKELLATSLDFDVLYSPFRENQRYLSSHGYEEGKKDELATLVDSLAASGLDRCYRASWSPTVLDAAHRGVLREYHQSVTIQDAELSVCGPPLHLYYSSSLFEPAFSVSIELQDELSDEQIDAIVTRQLKEDGDYCLRDSLYEHIKIPCSKEEKTQWVRAHYFYINQHVTYSKAEKPFGVLLSAE